MIKTNINIYGIEDRLGDLLSVREIDSLVLLFDEPNYYVFEIEVKDDDRLVYLLNNLFDYSFIVVGNKIKYTTNGDRFYEYEYDLIGD